MTIDSSGPRVPVTLGAVQQTLLIPLYARAVYTLAPRPLLSDPRAVQIVRSIDYDFAQFNGARSLFGTVLRASIFDMWVRRFLAEHPTGTVVDIGTGLNSRFERVDNGTARWFDLDLPDVIELRRRFFTETRRRRMIAASVLDPAWSDLVRGAPGPYLLVAEAVLPYLDAPQVHGTLAHIAERFPGAWVAFDTVTRRAVADQDRHDTLSRLAARMTWSCDDPAELCRPGSGLRLMETRTLTQQPAAFRARMSWRHRILFRGAAVLFRRQFSAYRLNLLNVSRW